MFRPTQFTRLASSLTRPALSRASPIVGSSIRPISSEALEKSYTFDLPENSFTPYELEAPSLQVDITGEKLINIYRQMTLVRRLEMAADALYKAKMIRGFCHLCTGQEAVPVGMEDAITRDDAVITAYRCHGFTYLRGATPTQVLAELLGRRAGISQGKGGSMHMFSRNFYGGNGIVGAQVPVGAGVAFTQHYLEQSNFTLALYGDGAANQGQVFEAYNMAKLWNLPIAFVCENNRYGMGTSANRSSASQEYYKRAGYIPGLRVNGMDVLAVRSAVAYAREWTTSQKGPILLEMETYRYGGHSMSDPGTTYRTREEIQHMRSTRDAITGLRQRIVDLELATEAELKAIDKEARAEVDKAVEESKASPEPELSELWTDIYVKGTEPEWIRGREPLEGNEY
ncbi:MAG: mitochondrial pyruvate dehydrogenase E1 component beta subunit [Piptocephalis tieghemiana]|nr:MAG: mitochondrial pyruvate dehydrogenase E1 component beta subunit [Piptocephalis tieghemiana]